MKSMLIILMLPSMVDNNLITQNLYLLQSYLKNKKTSEYLLKYNEKKSKMYYAFPTCY